MHYIIGYFASLTVFLALDAVWIMVIARAFYRRELRPLLRDNFLFTPALLFYLVYIAILFYLAVLPHTLQCITRTRRIRHVQHDQLCGA